MAEPTGLFLLKHMIIGRATSEAKYRTALLADPERMLSAEQLLLDYHRVLPPGKRLVVVEETDTQLYLVPPKKHSKLIVQAELANDPVLDLIAWAMTNEKGKEALKRDTRAFIRRRLDVDLGDEVTITVLEDTEEAEHVVLPQSVAYLPGDYYLAQHGALLAAGQAHASGDGWGGGDGGWGGGPNGPIPECVGCQPLTTDQTHQCGDIDFTNDDGCKCWTACGSGDILTWDTADAPTGPEPL